MASVFRLLVYAIVAVAIIGLVFFVMLPFLFPSQDNVAAIEKGLQAAEVGLGKGFELELFAGEGEGFGGKTFDSMLRNLIFQCNSASLCCPREKECPLAIEWNAKKVKFNETRKILAVARCENMQGLNACTLYIGKRPAQIEITSVEAPEKVELDKEKMHFAVEFSNVGNLETEQAEIVIEIFKVFWEGGIQREVLLKSASKAESVGKINAGETRQEKLFLGLEENGSFKAMVVVSGLEAGFDERTVRFEASGALDKCSADRCDSPALAGEKCIAKCYCIGCVFGEDCREKLIERESIALGIPPYIREQNQESEILGSNLVNFALPPELCP